MMTSPLKEQGFYKEERGIGLKVQRGIRRTSIPFPSPEDQRDIGKKPTLIETASREKCLQGAIVRLEYLGNTSQRMW